MVGPGEPGQKTGIWSLSIFGGSPVPIHDDAEDAVVSPQQDKIAFYHDDHGIDEVWVMGINGDGAARLVRGEPREILQNIHWSPDGKYVAFNRVHRKAAGFDATIERIPASGAEKPAVILSDARLSAYLWTPRNTLVYALEEAPPNEKDSNLWEMPLDAATGLSAGKSAKITSYAGFSFDVMSSTADGSRLAFLRPRYQVNVFLAEFDGANKVKAPVRITADEGVDVASAWTADGKAFFFTTDRNGNNDIFKQTLGKDSADEFVLGPEQQQDPVLTPDGRSVLYWSFPKPAPGEAPKEMQLKRIPVEGGMSSTVLSAGPRAGLQCPAKAGKLCVLSDRDAESKRMTFSTVDLDSGKRTEFARIDLHPAASTGWGISTDGASIAAAGFDEKKQTIRVIEVAGGASRDISVKNIVRVNQVAWLPDKSGFIVHGFSLRRSVVAKVEMNGEGHELHGEDIYAGNAVVSPDARKMVFSSVKVNSNVWVLEGF